MVAILTHAITGDTKAGTLIGTDRFGNKYYENMQEELPRKRHTREAIVMGSEEAKIILEYSPHTMGRLQGARIRRLPN